MKKIFNLTGTIVWIGLICYGIFYLFQNFQTIAINILAVIGGLALIVILIRLFYGENWMLNLGKQFFIGSDLIQATENFLDDLPKPSKESTANLVGHLVYRFTRLGVFGLALAAIPIWLLFNQNQLINVQTGVMNNQTTLLEKQTKRLDQQTYLQEAERRGSLVFLFSNVMDAIDREISNDIGEKGIRDLSPQLIGRIIALSAILKPYNYLDGDTLITKELSPERGQLLISIISSTLDSITLNKIFFKANFEDSDLQGANLQGASLMNINLREADLSDANLSEAKFQGADLSSANLQGTKLKKADLREAKLIGADLQGADLRDVKIIGNIDENSINHFGRTISEEGLEEYNLDTITLSKKDLRQLELLDFLLGNNFLQAISTVTDLNGANLKNVLLSESSRKELFNNPTISSVLENNYQLDSISKPIKVFFLREIEFEEFDCPY